MRRVLRALWRVALLALLWLCALSGAVIAWGHHAPRERADAAVVLGAAVKDGQPTPVFAARLDHGIELVRSGRVRWLVLTGGVGAGDTLAESEAGAQYAAARGVPPGVILVERSSHTTFHNLVEARRLMSAAGARTCLLVSDPYHLLRASWMAWDLALDCAPSATPTTRYQSLGTRWDFLKRELYFLHHYALVGE